MSNNAARLAAIDEEHGHLLHTLTETQKADRGLPYVANEPAMVRARLKARRIFLKYNQSQPSTYDPPDLAPGSKAQGIGGSNDDGTEVAAGVASDERRRLLADLFEMDYDKLAQVEIEVSCGGSAVSGETESELNAVVSCCLLCSLHSTATTEPTSS